MFFNHQPHQPAIFLGGISCDVSRVSGIWPWIPWTWPWMMDGWIPCRSTSQVVVKSSLDFFEKNRQVVMKVSLVMAGWCWMVNNSSCFFFWKNHEGLSLFMTHGWMVKKHISWTIEKMEGVPMCTTMTQEPPFFRWDIGGIGCIPDSWILFGLPTL